MYIWGNVMTAKAGRILLVLGLFSIFLNEKVWAEKWDNGHEESASVHAHPAYVRASYSPGSETSQEEIQYPHAPIASSYYVTNDGTKVRVFRTKTAHRSGRLFVNPPHATDASLHVDRSGDSILQGDDAQKENNNAERNEEDAAFLEPIAYTKQILRQEDPDSLVSYIQ